MKKYILLCVMSIIGTLFPCKSVAQFRISNTTNIELLGGYSSGAKGGWNVALGSEFILGSPEHSILVRLGYMNALAMVETSLSSEKFKIESANLNINYMYSLCRFINAPINVGLFGGLSGGYNAFPSQVNTLKIENPPGFSFGISVGCELEIYISNGFSVFISPQLLSHFGENDIKPFSFLANAGIKIRL